MNEQIQQIAARLAGLRDALEITPEEIAQVCQLTPAQYLELESGTVDIPVGVLHRVSQTYGIDLTTLMFGDDPKIRIPSIHTLKRDIFCIPLPLKSL